MILAILYRGIDESVTLWGFGCQKFEPLSEPWNEEFDDANAEFERFSKDPLFKELEIKVDPGWLLGCDMTQ